LGVRAMKMPSLDTVDVLNESEARPEVSQPFYVVGIVS
jgi:hypothetical protein